MKLLNKLITKTAIYKHLNELYIGLQAKYDYLKISNDNTREFVNELKQDITNKLKVIRKIRARVNKLDKKDENVKEIKRLIKEVL